MAYMALAMASYSLITTIFFLPESPRFLDGRKKYGKATKVLEHIQKVNGVRDYRFKLDEGDSYFRAKSVESTLSQQEEELEQAKDEKSLQGTFSELFKISIYRRNVLIMMIIWSFGSFAFFMVPFYLKNVKGNIYYLSFATEFAEFLASVMCFFI